MGVKFKILYHNKVVKEDIPKLSSAYRKRVKIAIEQRLTTEPETFGVPLRKSLKNYRKLRVGDYRVIFRIQGMKIKILIIAHRSVVYQSSAKRLS